MPAILGTHGQAEDVVRVVGDLVAPEGEVDGDRAGSTISAARRTTCETVTGSGSVGIGFEVPVATDARHLAFRPGLDIAYEHVFERVDRKAARGARA